MAFWNKWPYTSLQNLNLDWILNEVKRLKEEGVTIESVRTSLNELIGSNSNTAKNADKLGDKVPSYYLPAVNLMDNSYFRNPINQRGRALYTGNGNKPVYSIDRWYTWGVGATLTVNSDSITIVKSPFMQNIPITRFERGKSYTYAIKEKNGTLRIANAQYGSSAGSSTSKIYMEWVGNNGIGYRVHIYPSELEWAALYEGTYTSDTLPPFVTPDATLELVKCMRYYQRLNDVAVAFCSVEQGSLEYYSSGFTYLTPMRGIPTLSILKIDSSENRYGIVNNVEFITELDHLRTENSQQAARFITSKSTYAGCSCLFYEIELSCDL